MKVHWLLLISIDEGKNYPLRASFTFGIRDAESGVPKSHLDGMRRAVRLKEGRPRIQLFCPLPSLSFPSFSLSTDFLPSWKISSLPPFYHRLKIRRSPLLAFLSTTVRLSRYNISVGVYIRRYIRDFTFSSDLFLSTGKKLEINSYDKYYKGKDRCRCVYPCWYPFNTPLRITFAKFIHPEEKEKDRESRSRPDKQLSRMIHYDPSREENEENEEEEEKVEGPLKISKSSKLNEQKFEERYGNYESTI